MTGRRELSPNEVASELGITVMRVRQLIGDGTLPSVKRDGRRWVPAEAVAARLAAMEARAALVRAEHGHRWDWEGNIVAALERHLVALGWTVISRADPATRESGIDLVLERDRRRLLVEAKGSSTAKWSATVDRNQMGGLWLSAVLARIGEPAALVAIAVPEHATYVTLIQRLRPALERLDIGAFVVTQAGDVREVIAARVGAG